MEPPRRGPSGRSAELAQPNYFKSHPTARDRRTAFSSDSLQRCSSAAFSSRDAQWHWVCVWAASQPLAILGRQRVVGHERVPYCSTAEWRWTGCDGRVLLGKAQCHEESGNCILDVPTMSLPLSLHEGSSLREGCRWPRRSPVALPCRIDRHTRWALRGISLLRQSIDPSDLSAPLYTFVCSQCTSAHPLRQLLT